MSTFIRRCHTNHARMRARERHNLTLRHGELLEIGKWVHAVIFGEASAKQRERVQVLRTEYRGRPKVEAAVRFREVWLPVIYLIEPKLVVTILPKSHLPPGLRAG